MRTREQILKNVHVDAEKRKQYNEQTACLIEVLCDIRDLLDKLHDNLIGTLKGEK